MPVKTEFWVQAFIRKSNSNGLFAAQIRRGAAEAGAVFIIINRLDGTCRLLGPAPGPAYGDDGDRRFTDELPPGSPYEDCKLLLARRKSFDADLWIIEVEDRDGNAGLTVAE